MNTGSAVAWPNGGTPPIGNPVAARTVSASTREHAGAAAAAAPACASSSWLRAADVGEHDFAVDARRSGS